MTKDKAISKLRKLDERRAVLIKIINTIDESDIMHGTKIQRPDGKSYVVIQNNFGNYNLIDIGVYYERHVLNNHVDIGTLVAILNDKNCRIV